MNKCKNLSSEERRELLALPDVRDAWGFDDDCTPDEFGEIVFATKFDYMTDGPGYAGPLYLLQGGALETPMMVIRTGGALEVVHP